MFANLLLRASSLVAKLARYSVTRFGMLRVMKETAGFVIFSEGVDLAAEHSDWVKEHKGAILTLSLLTAGTVTSARALGSRLSRKVSTAMLFSKISIMNPAKLIAPFASLHSKKVWDEGCRILFNGGKDFVELAVRQGKLHYSHSGAVAAGVLLSSGFGAAGLREDGSDNDWHATAEQLSIVLADIEATLTEHNLEEDLRRLDPLTLLESGSSMLRAFLRENPAFSSERAVKLLTDSLENEETRLGAFVLDAFTDFDGDEIIEVNGKCYRVSTSGEGLLEQVDPSEMKLTYLKSDEGNALYNALVMMHDYIASHGNIEFVNVAGTTRFVSEVFTSGDCAVAIQLDNEKGSIDYIYSFESLFEKAEDGIIDVTEETFVEAVANGAKEFGAWLGVTEAPAVTKLVDHQQVGEGQLVSAMGKQQ